MFPSDVYLNRRNRLRSKINNGIILLPGNCDAPMNYAGNTYHFRQDSSFLYFFGINQPDLAGVLDVDSGEDILFGNDVDMDDIIWMGPQPLMSERAALAGVRKTLPLSDIPAYLNRQIKLGRRIHFLPPYRAQTTLQLSSWLGIAVDSVKNYASEELIKDVVSLREVKDSGEIAEIEAMVNVAKEMHVAAMKMAKPGTIEREVAGTIEGIALQKAAGVSFPVILSINGQTLHNHYHGNIMHEGRMMVADAGCESEMNYCSDITRTVPVGGKFSPRQKSIYEIVLNANKKAIETIKPGIFYRDVHILACTVIAEGLKELGLMKGDSGAAVAAGAHALFMPHGLGHMMGLDVHDMEDIGQIYVGYDNEVRPSEQFGTAYLRMGRKLQAGFIITVEPGIYFIPELVKLWKSENKFSEYINYNKVEEYLGFGGIRLEDDVLVTDTGYKILGKQIPKTIEEVENLMK